MKRTPTLSQLPTLEAQRGMSDLLDAAQPLKASEPPEADVVLSTTDPAQQAAEESDTHEQTQG